MSWRWVMLLPWPGAVVMLPLLCAGEAVLGACRWAAALRGPSFAQRQAAGLAVLRRLGANGK